MGLSMHTVQVLIQVDMLSPTGTSINKKVKQKVKANELQVPCYSSLLFFLLAAAASLRQSHSNTGSKLPLWPISQLAAVPDSYPLIEVRDWTHILMDTSQVHNSLNHNGSSLTAFLKTVFLLEKSLYSDLFQKKTYTQHFNKVDIFGTVHLVWGVRKGEAR